MNKKDKVCAVVVTRNRRVLLERCITALRNQTRNLDEILILNNDSEDDTRAWLESQSGLSVVHRENDGGAGGFSFGVAYALQSDFDWIWLMDDDAAPEPDCLEQLLRYSTGADALAPWQLDDSGLYYGLSRWVGRFRALQRESFPPFAPIDAFAFVGPLISTAAARRIGPPNKDYFIWFDDAEYALRLRRHGLRTLGVKEAVIRHNFGATVERKFLGFRLTAARHSPAKIYYGTRNHLYTVTRPVLDWRGVCYFPFSVFKMTLRNLIAQPEQFLTCLRMQMRGLRDGLLGRLGRRY